MNIIEKMNLYSSIINKIYQSPDKLNFRWRIVNCILLLLLISIVTLKYTNLGVPYLASTYVKQLIWISLGFFLVISLQWFRVQFLHEYAYHFYVILILLIISTYFMPVIGGSQRWIFIGSLSVQPSEIGKLLLVFTLARLISDFQGKITEVSLLSFTLILALVPSILVFNQPDFGTAIVYAFIAIPMLYWGGVSMFYIFYIIAPFISIISAFDLIAFSIWMLILIIVIYFHQSKILLSLINFLINISFGVLSPFIWNNFLYNHQRERILTLFNPMRDPQGAGYQVIQSITAIGSGGVWGRGLGKGTQTQLRFLPVRDTDFIISVIGEEMGLIGIILIMILFFMMLYWIISYAGTISNKFSSLTLIGFSSILFIHLIVNIGMTVGLLPVTGLPVPFISYGGSFLITCFIMLALANNIINKHII